MVVENQVVGFCNLPIQMAVIILFLFLVTILISVPTAAQQVFYVSPDNSTNTSCPFQPCATLSQYLLDNNGSLPVVSNVEYHFLPGEHHVPTNMTLQYLHNFTISGYQFSSTSAASTVIISSLYTCTKIFDSVNVTIDNIIFKMHNSSIILENPFSVLYNLVLENCFSCKITKVIFLEFRFQGRNLLGKSYVNDVLFKVTDEASSFTSIIYLLYYTSDFTIKHYGECMLIVNNISVSYTNTQLVNDAAIYVLLLPFKHTSGLTIIIVNSYFHNINHKILKFVSVRYATYTNTIIKIKNCTFFGYNIFFDAPPMFAIIDVELPQFNVTLLFTNCEFIKNKLTLFSVEVLEYLYQDLYQNPVCDLLSRVIITNCLFLNNSNEWTMLHFIGSVHKSLKCVNIYIIGPIFIYGNNIVGDTSEILINFDHVAAHINGPIYIYQITLWNL